VASDNGTEFTAGQFAKKLKAEGITLETTAPYDHHQAGAKNLWGEISLAVVYIKNRSPTAALKGRTPYEALHGRVPDLRRLRALGCKAVAHRPAEKRSGKLDDRATEGIFIGYLIKSNDVVFFETDEKTERVRVLEPSSESEDDDSAMASTQKPTTRIPSRIPAQTRPEVVQQEPVVLRRSSRATRGQHKLAVEVPLHALSPPNILRPPDHLARRLLHLCLMKSTRRLVIQNR